MADGAKTDVSERRSKAKRDMPWAHSFIKATGDLRV